MSGDRSVNPDLNFKNKKPKPHQLGFFYVFELKNRITSAQLHAFLDTSSQAHLGYFEELECSERIP